VFFQEIPSVKYRSQFDWVVESLLNDKYSRQAVINFNQPMHKYDTKDFVCTLSMQFFIRNNELVAITNMRSNDFIYGFGYDLPFFCLLQQLVYSHLLSKYPALQLGAYTHHAASLHVYDRHFEMVDTIANNIYGIFKSESGKLYIGEDDHTNIMADIYGGNSGDYKSRLFTYLNKVKYGC
jgi:thymidylate synthase